MAKTSDHLYDSMEHSLRAAYLITGFILRKLTTAEELELDRWLLAKDANMELFSELTSEERVYDYLQWYESRNIEKRLRLTRQRIGLEEDQRVRHHWWKYAAAALFILAIGFLAYLMTYRESSSPRQQATIGSSPDLQPGTSQAVLHMQDGKVISLYGNLDTSIGDQVLIRNGIVEYNQLSEQVTTMQDLTVPRKAHYQLRLPDGTNVWLNAESSIRYPSSFSGPNREVTVTGETYFEVAKDKAHPFIVTTGDTRIEAVGTAFNINSYPDEAALSTTLLEGSVKVSQGLSSVLLLPMQQALAANGQITLQNNVDIISVIAWKNNEFKMRNSPLEVVMRMLARWYDTKIVYKEKVNFHFNGTISRDVPLSQVLHLLEETGHVHFLIEEGQITVSH